MISHHDSDCTLTLAAPLESSRGGTFDALKEQEVKCSEGALQDIVGPPLFAQCRKFHPLDVWA